MRWWLLACLAAGCDGGFHKLEVGDLGAADGDSTGFTTFDDAPDGGAWRAVWGSSPTHVYVAGEGGHMLAWDGTQLMRANLGSGNDLYGLWGSGGADIWTVGTVRTTQTGVLFHKTDLVWIQFGTTKLGLRSVWGTATQRIAVGLSGGIFTGPVATPFAMGMQAQPNVDIPQTANAPILYSVGGNGDSSIMVAGDVDSTFYFDTTWHAFEDPVDRTRAFRSIWGAPSATPSIYEGANYFGLWHFTSSTDPVITLNEEQDQPENIDRSMWAIWGLDDQRIVAVGDAGRIMTFDAASQEVRVRASPTTRSLYGVWGSSFDDLWIVGEGGLILRGKIAF